jgi:hypothetical protein
MSLDSETISEAMEFASNAGDVLHLLRNYNYLIRKIIRGLTDTKFVYVEVSFEK